jgi:predicted GIY-YIG superfamily endonuclease
MSKERTWTRYILRDNGKIVYVGITRREFPEARIQQHADEGKHFTSYQFFVPRVTEEGARSWEQEKVETYKDNHEGKGPKYNKT